MCATAVGYGTTIARNSSLFAATTNLISRRDVVIVASVSCIFGLGSPEEYKQKVIRLDRGQTIDRQDLLRAFNEAMNNISAWPRRQPAPNAGVRPVQTLYGRRRLDWFSRHANGFATELRMNPLVKQLAGTSWLCSGAWQKLVLTETGDSRGGETPDGRGRWATMNDPTLGDTCPVYSCIFVDIGGGWGREAETVMQWC